MTETVIVNDVGPRDGLQNQATILTPAQRLQLIQALVDAVVSHTDFGAFVSPKSLPAMAGAAAISAAFPPRKGHSTALLPNRRGCERRP